ncbi:hypothetical protein AAF712_001269 [Marasmius tenuissimus]|uniref:Uncharacterized protein n=1 Tax=Marasmius tenuissimus TaxID=585030 RepID=A0ABR3AFR3_9AGAR
MFDDLPEPTRRKAIVSKRAVLSSDDEEETGAPASSPPPTKRQRLNEEDSYQNDFVNVDEDEDQGDRDGYDEDIRPSTKSKRRIVKPKRYEQEEEEERPPAPSTSKPTTTTKNKRKKSKKADLSDEDTDDQFDLDADDLAQDLGTLDDDDDDDEFEDEPKRAKSKAKGGSNSRGQKGKGKESSRKAKPTRPSLNAPSSPLVDVVDDQSYPSPNVPAPSTSQIKESGSPPQKKRKLPNIKKNKPNATGTPVLPAKKPTLSVPVKGTEEADITKTLGLKAAPPPVSADLDLRNNNVYAELFNRPGASNIRAGVSRREKEEQRRKELDKMRDEARVKRSAEGRDNFALQAQMDKILRFEERLKKSNSPALYPNILGAKMREMYDAEKKRRAREPSRNGPARPGQDLEEGEMA